MLFDGDSNSFCTNKDLPSLIETVNFELIIIVAWFNANEMVLDMEHKYLIWSSDQGIRKCKIKHVQTTQFLRVIIECNLACKYHVNYAWRRYPSDLKLFLYISIIGFLTPPVGVHLWYLYEQNITVAERVRLIHGVNRRAHSEPLLVQCYFY